jgi:hypothetical protein
VNVNPHQEKGLENAVSRETSLASSRLRSQYSLATSHWSLATFLLLFAGCSRDLDTIYGQRQGIGASASVNGTAVLGELFQQAGHHVFSWSVLSPHLKTQADCIVWFPNDFEPPTENVRAWLENWLNARPRRTLIYVGRDFDAAPWYWKHVLPGAPPEQKTLLQNRLTEAEEEFAFQRQFKPKTEDAKDLEEDGWFAINDRAKRREVRTLDAGSVWRRDIDASRLEIELNGRMILPKSARKLLASKGDAIVGVEKIGKSKLILVANGSFLLNLPLVNHEHRKLAAKLIDMAGPAGKTVAFLESYAGGPSIRDEDPTAKASSGLEIFNSWPTNWILIHLAVLGIIFCFSRWPIFGLAREEKTASEADFGRHIDALADMLERSGDRNDARKRVANFKEKDE